MEELKKKINDLKKQANTSNIVGAVILVASIAGWLIGTLKKIKALSGFSIIFIIVSVVFFIFEFYRTRKRQMIFTIFIGVYSNQRSRYFCTQRHHNSASLFFIFLTSGFIMKSTSIPDLI